MLQMTDPDAIKTLAANGPWAVMAGFLLWTILKAWTGDRNALTDLMSSFKTSIDGLREAVEYLTIRLDAHEDERRAMTRRVADRVEK